MIKKDYFPTKDAPEWVKAKVMSNVIRGGKSFRLMYLMKHKAMTTVSMLILVTLGSYLYLQNGAELYINPSLDNDGYTVNTTNISDTNADNILQNKINKAESDLNNLYDNLNKETNITF